MIDRRLVLAGGATWALAGRALAAERTLDVAYLNANALTGDSRLPRTDAIGLVGDRIAALGRAAVRVATGPRTRIVDLGGAFVTPGFIDNHTRFLIGSATLGQPDLLGTTSRPDFAARLGAASRARPGKSILGGTWDEQRLGGALPTRAWIDAATGDTPVAVPRTDLHMYLLNGAALRAAGITRATPDVAGGEIGRDAQGEPTGILKDNAKQLVERVFPTPTDAEREATMRDDIAHALRYGFTRSIRLSRSTGPPAISRAGFAQGARPTSASIASCPRATGRRWRPSSGRRGAATTGFAGARVKALADGSLGSRTAVFDAPYTDAAGQTGVRVTSPADLKAYVTGADKARLHVATHAIGDLANDDVLDLYGEVAAVNGARDRRFRIEHAQHLSVAAIPRFAPQGVIASVQPFHAIDDGR